LSETNAVLQNSTFEDVLLDALPNPVYYKDMQGMFIRCNASFSTLLGRSKQDIIGKSAYEFFPKIVADKHKKIDKNIMNTLNPNEDEVYLIQPNGNILYFILSKAVSLHANGEVAGIVCIMNDITQRIKEKEFLIQQSKFAEMGEMIASIAHQWNEPLVELSAQIQKMQLYYSMDKIDKNKMTHFVNDSMVQIQYMSETLSDFRNFLKPSIMKKDFGIKKALREIFDIVGKQIFYFNIKVNFNYEKIEDEMIIYGFENEMKQVLLNIINNAKNKIVKINEKKDLKGEISISLLSSVSYNTIEIKDNAGAINKNIMGKLFEPFFTTKINGTGFGLYMAKIIIEDKMHGKIFARNEDKHAIFTIQIPKNKVK